MKPLFAALKLNHQSSNRTESSYASGEDIYKQIGYSLDALMKQDPGYENTCAVRMSLALIKSGVAIQGRLKIKAGPYEGRTFEPGAKLLADQLSRPSLCGKPMIIDPTDAVKPLNAKKGIVFFWKIFGYGGGHIDLLEWSNAGYICHSNCYPLCKEIWFWPLQ